MELIIEEKKPEPISYESILKKMNLKVIDGKLSQDQPAKKNVYFYPQENKINPSQQNIQTQNTPQQPLLTVKQQYMKYLIHKINQKKRIAQIKSKRMFFI
jgi:hypothetical protein